MLLIIFTLLRYMPVSMFTVSLLSMTVHEKIIHLRTLAGMNQRQFAELVGLAPSTITRLENPAAPIGVSGSSLKKIASAFNEISEAWLLDDADDTLPADLTTAAATLLQRAATADTHEGQALAAFLDKFDRSTLNRAMLGRQLGVSRNQVGSYLSTRRFESSVRESLLPALSVLLHRPVTEQELFGIATTAADPRTEQFVAVPRLTLADRRPLTGDLFRLRQLDFNPALFPDTGFFAPVDLVPVARIRAACALEVGPSDKMEPYLRPGYWVLAFLLTPDEFSRLYEGTVAIVTTDGEFLLRQIVANRLRTADVLEVGPYTPDRGSIRPLHRADIALCFSVPAILRGALS